MFHSSNRALSSILVAATCIATPALAQLGKQFTTSRPITELTLPAADVRTPSLTEDELSMVFASNRTGGAGGFDLYETTRPHVEAKWATPSRIPTLNSSSHDWMPWMSPNGLELWFVQSRPNEGRVLYSTRTSRTTPWNAPSALPTPINGANLQNSYPAVTEDGLRLFFVRRTTSGETILESVRSTRTSPWGAPSAFLPSSTFAGDKGSVVPLANGLRVLFVNRAPQDGPRWYTTHIDPITGKWIPAYELIELHMPPSIEGWTGGLTGRIYQTTEPSSVQNMQFEERCYKLGILTVNVCIEISTERVWSVDGWLYIDQWEWIIDTPSDLVSYDWSAPHALTAWFVSGAILSPIRVPGFDGSPLLIDPSQMLVLGATTISNGLGHLQIKAPNDPKLIGNSVFIQGLRVDPIGKQAALTGACKMRFVK